MPYIERPDIAIQHASEVNAKLNPAFLSDVPENFGVNEVPIYFYNVGPLEFNEPRYPNHPHMLIRACPPGTPYIMARGSISHPFQEIRLDQNENKFVVMTNGYREASKMLNPMNPGTDQNWHEPTAMNEYGNLNQYGVFWSIHNPPLENELAEARARMEATFKRELELMVRIEAQEGPAGAQSRVNNLSRAAAKYFNQTYSWFRLDLIPQTKELGKVECWACGEQIRPKALLCMHCGAPMEDAKRQAWLDAKFAEKRGPGRPAGS